MHAHTDDSTYHDFSDVWHNSKSLCEMLKRACMHRPRHQTHKHTDTYITSAHTHLGSRVAVILLVS